MHTSPDNLTFPNIPRIFYCRTWLVLFPDEREVIRRYQWPVNCERVLADHRAAVAAIPISGSAREPVVIV